MLCVLCSFSLLTSNASLFGRTIGRVARSLFGIEGMPASAARWTKYDWEGPKPATLSAGGDAVIVNDWTWSASGGLLFSWQHDRTNRIWVEDQAPDGLEFRHEDPETLMRAIEVVNLIRSSPLPAAAATGPVRTRMLNPVGITGDALAVSSLVYLCVTRLRRKHAAMPEGTIPPGRSTDGTMAHHRG